MIPEGRVATYGQVARLIGRPQAARQVGYALAVSGREGSIPWHRVINAKGQVSTRANPGDEEYQRVLLEAEGIVFDGNGRVSLPRYQWEPIGGDQQRVIE